MVCESGNHHVQVFGSDGEYLRVLPSPNDPNQNELYSPYRAFSTADGNVMIADHNDLRVFSSEGLFIKNFKPSDHPADASFCPDHVSFGVNGEIILIDFP